MSTHTPIASQTLTSAAATITFNNIPQNYTDLILIFDGVRTSGGDLDLTLRFNSDTTSTYSDTEIRGSGSTAQSYRNSNQTFIRLGVLTLNRTTLKTNIMNYSNTTTFKTVISRQDSINTDYGINLKSCLWRNTSAITSLTIGSGAGNIELGSTANLYGIAAGDVTAKATGGIVTTSGGYYYHTFTSSGTFTPLQNLTVDYLVVAGGGGGGNNIAGAGGAGGLRCTVGATGGGGALESALSLTKQPYSVIIGAGGTKSTTSANGANGSNTVFGSIISNGGGGGGSPWGTGQAANSGGSGGGAGGNFNSSASGGSGTSNQGYAGGNSTQNGNPPYVTAGGGGAGGAGGNANGSTGDAGAGGIGVQTSISGTATYYAGGGGGSSSVSGKQALGGNGGGGNGGVRNSINGTAGTANTGGGGAGGTYDGGTGDSTNGGSGIVIVRYSV